MRHAPTPRPPVAGTVGPTTPHLYVPTADRPVRAKANRYLAETQVVPHQHPWAQLVHSTSGVVRVTVERGTFLAPPSRVVWIPPGMEHAVTVVESCEMRTLYLRQPPGRCGPACVYRDEPDVAVDEAWMRCRVLEVSELLHALMLALSTADDRTSPSQAVLEREARLGDLIVDELLRARPVPLGVALPQDKRLRALCEAILDDPARHARLDDWAVGVGASARTLARLFRAELGISYGQWRQQAMLARALTLVGRGRSMRQIAGELGYASPSAFSAMVRRALGAPPSRSFLA